MKTNPKEAIPMVQTPMLIPGIAIPSTGRCCTDFATSLAHLTATFAAGAPILPGHSQQLLVRCIQSSGISTNREALVEAMLGQGATHILFLDDDMRFPAHSLHRLMRHQVPIVGVNYRMRHRGADFCAMDFDDQTRIQTTATSTGLEPCLYMGFGVCLIERQVFEAIPKPWFMIEWSAERGYTTEDKPFFRKAREAGFIPQVDHDLSKAVVHLGLFDYRWEDG